MNIRKHTAMAIFAALLATNSALWIPMALANPVVPAQGALGPKTEEARNGMTVVNINTPNDKGLSHNQYDAFNVDNKGLILNNANRPVNTELAGYIMGNPNLVGPTANTILNEVTGTGATSMNGALEVAGNKAHVIIANPNGISVNNGTFINANSATLTTGNPIINNGSITGYQVQQGSITVGEKGLNASKTARTDLLAEAVQLNGKVWAKDAQVVTGKNAVSVDSSGKVTNVHKTGESSQVGLDVAAIGGMYANSMYLVGTNDGFGVNNQGVLSAQNKLTVDSTGKLQNIGTIAATDADVTTKSFEQMNRGKLYVDTAKITTDSVIQKGNIETKDAPVMIAQKDLSIATNSIVNTDGSVIKAEGQLQLGKTMDSTGTVSGKIDRIVNTASTIEFGQGGALYAKSVDNKNGGITLKRVAVGEKEHVKNEVAPSGSIKRYQLSEERIYGHDDEIPKDKVVVHSSENLQLSVYGDPKDSWTKYEYDRTREKDVVDTSNPGRIISGGDLHMDVDHMVNDASQISAAGDITGTVGHYEQSNPKGNEYITEDGTATSYSRHHKKGWDTTNIREAKYKNTKVNPKDVPVAVYGGHVENSKSDATVDASLLHSMSQLSTNPNTTYVIETDPNFTDRRNFLSSDYVLSRLKLDPMNVQKRLGDGYYEQQLVMQEIMSQTGKSRLQSGLSAEEQYRQLMDAGISVTKSQSIVLGRGLTEAEQKNLKEDVVLLVSKAVVLPNGKTETVLVPTLYLAPTTKRVEGAANLQAQSITLSVDTMHNSGSIVADKDVTITGNTIHNDNGLIKGNMTTVIANDEVRNTQGTIIGNDTVSVYAKKDVINEGGTITQTNAAGSTKVTAGRDVINTGVQYEAANSKVEWNSRNNRRETMTGVDQGRIGGAGETTVVAGRDVSMAAGVITSDVNTHVAAGHSVTMKAMNATHELEEHRFDKGKSGGGHSQTTESHDLVNAQSLVGSSIEGKNVSVVASDAVQLEGSQLLAADTVKVSGNTVELNTAKANSTVNHVYLDKKKSLVKRESTNAVDDVTTTAVTGSTVSGKDIQITSAQDVTGQSAQIMGENAVSVTAGGKVDFGADKAITDGTSVYRHKKSGLLGSTGIGFTIGKEKHNIDEANHEESTVRNTIASTKGTVTVKANDTVRLTSADIVAKEGAVLEGSAVTLDGNVDHNHMTHDERYKKTGLTVSLGGAVADTLTNATRTIKQAGGRDDKRLAALELNEARKQLQDGYAAVDKAVKGVKLRDADGKVLKDAKNHSRRGQKNIDDAVNLSVSIGGTSRKQGQEVDTNTYQGGTLVSDSEVQIKARDAEQGGIGLTGETVQAKNLVLDSASDINLAAGKNTVDVKNTYKSSGWSVGAGISLTGGGLIDINASGNMARQNGDTHQESYVPTTIKAAQLAQLKAKRDTTIIGATVSGKKVEVDTGRDLHIQSLQDVDNFKEHSKSAGFSVSSKPNFKDPTGSISASVGRIDSKWKSVTHQAGIFAGEEGYDINVGNGTTLEGAVIKSEAPKAKNTLTTKSLEMKDIQNEAEYTYSNNGIGYNYYGSKKKLEEMKTNDKKGYDKIYNSIGLVPNLGVGSKGKASSTTQSAISDGILTVDGKEIDTKTINTNTENTLHQLDKIFDKKKIEERQELARLFSKNAFEQLHNWQPTTKEGKVAKSIAHGVIGELAARMAGNAPGSAFKATMTNELLIGEIKKVAKHDPALAQWLSATVGGVVNKVSGESSNSGAATASYATKWNAEGLFHVDRVDLDGISEDNKDLALADLNYDLAQSNRYNINKLREKKKYIRKDHLYSESKGIGAGITDVVGIGFSRGYGIDSEGSSYVTDQVSIGASAFPVQSTTSDTRVLYGEQGFTGGAISISMNTGGGKSYSLGPTNITESKTMNVSPEATISFSYTEKLESEVPSEYVVNDTSVDLSTYTPDQPDGVYSPPPTEPEAEIRATTQEESTENYLRMLMDQFEFSA
ncbi:putative septum site-determining protein MinC [Veillonella atypica ACS-134-V-Col7a]|uniref:Putative septum site-determining protein MinC n=1 Tax=Veillonella atypica ACS-134-V-Col7a TaxID=866778 RepID=E1LCV2_9FIRM|nr:hemagglutinin repeat-containing protein [Veillonella atypica]EFL57564.1 putative septum site-determining protein MinC [Veillonella atypica ACS-134-V-Col7a]